MYIPRLLLFLLTLPFLRCSFSPASAPLSAFVIVVPLHLSLPGPTPPGLSPPNPLAFARFQSPAIIPRNTHTPTPAPHTTRSHTRR